MTEQTSVQDLFKGRHFDQEMIVLCIRWYLTFKLSSRDLVHMMAERGIALAHTTILRWVQRYVPEFEKRWSRYARKALARKRSAAAASRLAERRKSIVAPVESIARYKYIHLPLTRM
jgi:hypothetical protein